MIKYASLGSGSSGNATLVQSDNACILVDCGFSIKETDRRLALLGLSAQDIDAVIVTHEHGDHLRGVAPLARRYKLPVFMTHGTFHAARDQNIKQLQLFHADDVLNVGDIKLQSFAVPHDANEASQFTFDVDGLCLGLLTDTGSITQHIVNALSDCDALILECNHDAQMLRDGPYPPGLQARVGGPYGHLENLQSAQLLSRINVARLQQLWLAHLSERNNHPDKALAAIEPELSGLNSQPLFLQQNEVQQWVVLENP